MSLVQYTDSRVSAIVERFDRIRRDHPARPLIHLPLTASTISAGDLWELALAQRKHLERLGAGQDRLLISAAGNRPAYFALWLACRSLGAALMPVDSGTTTAEIRELARRFGASFAVLGDPQRAAELGVAEPFVAGLAIVSLDGQPAPELYRGAAVLKLTSGSTGLPKATFTTEQQLLDDTAHIMEAMDIRPDDCQMSAIPLSHAYGIGNLVVPLLVCGTAVVLRDGFVPHQFPRDAAACGARVFPGVPFMFDHFKDHLSPGAWPRRLERLISAGATLEPATVRGFHGSFGLKVHSFYGTSETGGIAFDDSAELGGEGSVGRPLPGVAIALAAEEGAPHGSGRVHVSGSAVASGYAGGAPGGEGFTSDGGFLTGDYGRFDAAGHLVLTGRASAFINVAGRKVLPDEVERVLRTMPGVADVRVIGVDDAARGQQIVACVVARGASPGIVQIREYCAARLAAHKIPRAVLALERIPLTERGKTDRRRLQELVQEQRRGVQSRGVP
jgi:acyl-CoA synthetase (AMP-forming)/AMP-acid ligase II